MSLKKFYRDLALAKTTSFGHVSSIRRGELEDGIAFTYSDESMNVVFDMELVIRDVTEYTKGATFMLVTSYGGSGKTDVSENLQALSEQIPAQGTVCEILAFLSDSLATALTTHCDDGDISQTSDFDEASFMDEDYADGWDDPLTATDEQNNHNIRLADNNNGPAPGNIVNSGLAELKSALYKAKAARLIIGLLPAEPQQFPRFISLAIRVSVLGLPSDVLEAWGLKSGEYLVLLIHFANGYPSLARYQALPEKQLDVQFRFGKCAAPKPSQKAASQAFFGTGETRQSSTTSENPKSSEDDMIDPSAFLANHMSAPINRQLNQSLHTLLRLRRGYRTSWGTAHELLRRLQTDPDDDIQPMDVGEEAIISPDAPEALKVDYALDDEDQVSIPLVAMQFALRQLVRCTESCVACQESMGEGLGSGCLKPYVCEKPLCLYQYLSLGFGPSIEHEIINNPLVVDFLVSLLYSAVMTARIREVPLALAVKVPNVNKAARGAVVRVNETFTSVRVPFGNEIWKARVRTGQLFLVADTQKSESQSPHPGTPQRRAPAIHAGPHVVHTDGINIEPAVEVAVCRADSDAATGSIHMTRLSGTFTVAPAATSSIRSRVQEFHLSKEPGWNSALVLDFDDTLLSLSDDDQRASLALLMTCIPPVREMRDWLLKNPERALSEWDRVDRSLVVLLTWIIASNRSHLVPDQQIPDQGARPNPQTTHKFTHGDQGVPGYLRFRFLQGAPGKESQFEKAAQHVNAKGSTKFPTIFAWHGSPMGNWHSIIRTGLDFSTISHGRAYGNGIYLSPHMGTSNTYSRDHPGGSRPRLYTMPQDWSNAELSPLSAISLCEVVNRKKEFVSTTPHYVVNRIDWVQCRYLYVEYGQAVTKAINEWIVAQKKQPFKGYVPQASSTQLLDAHEYGDAEHADELTSEEISYDDWSGDDLELLGPDSATECPYQGETKPQGSAPTLSTERRLTPYVPGTLDLSSIPKLPEPSWAASSSQALKVLSREVKDLHRIQSTMHFCELGWSVNMEAIDNLFRWIVELHSFDTSLPLGRDMIRLGVTSIVLEVRFGAGFPMSPPFVRVVRPRFLPFSRGGGGHVTMGGAICSELLTNSGWLPTLSMEKVLLQVRLGLCELDPAARLDLSMQGMDYNISEAVEAYKRAAAAHGWQIPAEMQEMTLSWR
ncbi:E2 ubiquitin-conjugating enzyme [Purpureocillium takamizusanense]|uniref:E2 ubiquitin-conjugating enzyme n=1 Tax=Purpureocillium takamizusanense TaxID=2060973 RepID=A0A9Q8QIH4_9HYPO|nr:E2 ubiquitin-conjugating enzyme [Purpureocillium takamizusanense]UNI19842.1 E2 ubiquitin-conjugating enzyme [Purpureocillium takamizusanense]